MGILAQFLGKISGNEGFKASKQLLFDKVIGFKGLSGGVGTSTIVQSLAIALSENSNYSICVVDSSFLNPTIYPMLVDNVNPTHTDYLEFNGDISVVGVRSKHRNITIFSLANRTIVDLLSSKDNEVVVGNLIGTLKSYFDVILIDLSNEPTNITTAFAIKCNTIVTVGDQSLRCLYNLRRTLNTMMTLAIPKAKANKVIINKIVPGINADPSQVFSEAGMTVIGKIPLSTSLATAGIVGSPIYDPRSTDKDIYHFSGLINTLIDTLFVTTPLTEEYTDPAKVEEAKRSWKDLFSFKKKSKGGSSTPSAVNAVSPSTEESSKSSSKSSHDDFDDQDISDDEEE